MNQTAIKTGYYAGIQPPRLLQPQSPAFGSVGDKDPSARAVRLAQKILKESRYQIEDGFFGTAQNTLEAGLSHLRRSAIAPKHYLMGAVQLQLAKVYAAQSLLAPAIEAFKQGITIFEEPENREEALTDKKGISINLLNRQISFAPQQDLLTAYKLLAQTCNRRGNAGDSQAEKEATASRGKILIELGQKYTLHRKYDAAEESLNSAVTLFNASYGRGIDVHGAVHDILQGREIEVPQKNLANAYIGQLQLYRRRNAVGDNAKAATALANYTALVNPSKPDEKPATRFVTALAAS